MLTCDKCGAAILEDARFCAQCGDPVTDADTDAPTKRDSKAAEVVITFGYSSSANYGKAVAICENLDSHSVKGEGRQTEHTITLPITEIELLVNLYELVGSWKSSGMLIDGQAETKSALVYYGAGCFRERQKAYDRDLYCFGESEHAFNIWGCVKLQMPIYEWGGGWLEYGKLDRDGVWHVDKNRIRHELEMAYHEVELCPVLDYSRLMKTLEKLPDTIDPKRSRSWKHTTEYGEVGGKVVHVPTGIKPVLRYMSRYVIGGYKPSWKIESDEGNGGALATLKVPVDSPIKRPSRRKRKAKKGKGMGCLFLCILLFFAAMFSLIPDEERPVPTSRANNGSSQLVPSTQAPTQDPATVLPALNEPVEEVVPPSSSDVSENLESDPLEEVPVPVYEMTDQFEVGAFGYEIRQAKRLSSIGSQRAQDFDVPDPVFLCVLFTVGNFADEKARIPTLRVVDEEGAEYGEVSNIQVGDRIGPIEFLESLDHKTGVKVYCVPQDGEYFFKVSDGEINGSRALVKIDARRDLETTE